MADAARFGEEAQNHRTRYRELQEATEFPKSKQSKLLAAMERKQQLRSLSPALLAAFACWNSLLPI